MTETLMAAVMTHRLTVERNSADPTDRYAAPTWATFLSDQPCFLSNQAGIERVAPERTADVDRMRLMLPKGTGISANDRVTSVTRDGTEILGGTANIVAPLRDHHDHDEAEIQLVTGGA